MEETFAHIIIYTVHTCTTKSVWVASRGGTTCVHKSLQVQCIDAIAAMQVNALALVVLGCIIAHVMNGTYCVHCYHLWSLRDC